MDDNPRTNPTKAPDIGSNEFFWKIGVDPKTLSAGEKKQFAIDFLGFFMAKTLNENPESYQKLDKYLEEFSRLTGIKKEKK